VSIIRIVKTFWELLKHAQTQRVDYRLLECQICHEMVIHSIKIPSSTGLWVCYDCISYYLEGFTLEEILHKTKHHWRNKAYKE